MKLKDYVNFRREKTNSKASNYLIRTQSFYDGKKIVVKNKGEATGILAKWMNGYNIPTT